MSETDKLAFREIYIKYNNAKVNKCVGYIENYMEIIYDFLKVAMYNNFKEKKINEKIKDIYEYCDLVIEIKGLPKPIKEAFKLIKGDYKYLYLSNNIDYYFKEIYELKAKTEENTVYVDDIISDIRESVSKEEKNANIVSIMKVLKNKYKVLDRNLVNIFFKSFC